MNLVDLAIVMVMTVSTFIGWYRGLIKEVFSLAAWVAAVWLAYLYAPIAEVYLEPYVSQQAFRVVIAFAGIFVVVLVSISLVSYLLFKLVQFSGISGVDKALGGGFGVIRGVIAVSLLILGAYFMGFPGQPWWQDSLLVDLFNPVNEWVKSFLPEDITQHLYVEV